MSLRPLGHPSLEPTVLKYPAEKPPENAPWNRLGRPLSITSDTRRPRALPRKRGGGRSSRRGKKDVGVTRLLCSLALCCWPTALNRPLWFS